MENQLTILAESLKEKIKVLTEIQEYNRLQEQAFVGNQARLEDFDAAVEEKGKLIERLNQLDEGFEILYEELSRQLQGNRQKYAEQIQSMQQQITRIMELSVAIEAQEKRNKQLVEQFFARERKTLGQNRKASRAAYDYYRKLNPTVSAASQYYDVKK